MNLDIVFPPFYVFQGRLNIQHGYFARHHVPEHSLLSQIHLQFSSGMEQFNGLFFIDFDNTLLNWDFFAHRCRHEAYFNDFYNGAPRQIWRDILKSLRDKKFLIVLCTSRLSIANLDDIFKKIIYQDLVEFFHCHLFTGQLDYKGAVINYIRNHILKTQGISYLNENVYLLDDQVPNLNSATAFNISTIQSYAAPQHPIAPFIEQLRAIRAPVQLPPFQPANPLSPRMIH